MNWINPYKNRKGAWLKGNLHTHSGEGMTQDEIFSTYGKLGYDFICISDHRKLTLPKPPKGNRILVLPGFEWNSKTGDHMNMISFDCPTLVRSAASQDTEKVLKSLKKKPVLVVMNHPNWREPPHYSRETLYERSLSCEGLEIYNGLVDFGAGAALATEKWDYLLSRRRMVLGFANDDAHSLKHIGQAWNVVRAASRTPRAIFKALREGNFYCSTGATFDDIRREGTRITVSSPDAQEIWAIGEWGARMEKVLSNRMEFDFATVQSAHAKYVRFVAFGKGAAMAWTQPFLKEPNVEDRRLSPFVAQWSVSNLLSMPLGEVTDATARDETLTWKPLRTVAVPEGFATVTELHGTANGIALLSARISVARSGRWITALGHDGGARLFVDGRLVIDQPVRSNPANPDRSKIELSLKKGQHSVLVALNTDHGKGQGVFLRFILPGKAPKKPVFPVSV
jgi:hypothetical protein